MQTAQINRGLHIKSSCALHRELFLNITIMSRNHCSHRILSPYRSINYLLQKSEAFQSVHHVTFILCYTVLYNFFALVFSLIRVRKHWWDDITQGKLNFLKQVKSQSEFREVQE